MSTKIVWVGPRESDILYSGISFFHSVTYNGSNQNSNISFTSKVGTRIDHITQGAQWHLKKFICDNLKLLIRENPDVRFLFYNPAQCLNMDKEIVSRTLCVLKPELYNIFRNKALMREFAQDCVAVVPYAHFFGKTLPNVHFDHSKDTSVILQTVHSSAGAGTHQFTWEECKKYVSAGTEGEEYIVSPYMDNAIPVNVHIIVFKDKCVVLPASIQLIEHRGGQFSYIGADFHAFLTSEQRDKIQTAASMLGEKMRTIGYRGICGIDFMVSNKGVYFLEINARFQSSTFLTNKLLRNEGKPSLHQLNLMAFFDATSPINSFQIFHEPESFFTLNGSYIPSWIVSKRENITNNFNFLLDGLSHNMKLTSHAYLCRVVTKYPLCWISTDYQLRLAPNILRDDDFWRSCILSKDMLKIKIGLLTQGIRFSLAAEKEMTSHGKVRAGVFQSLDLVFPNGLIVNSPYNTRFSSLSPYCVEWNGLNYILYYEDTPLSTISFAMEDPYKNRKASRGTSYRHAVFLATDRLRVHHELHCYFKENDRGCLFCNIKMKSGKFSLDDVCEIIDFYLKNVPFRHFLIGGGSGTNKEEPQNILKIARHIRSRSNRPIYAMCLPPKDLNVLSEFYDAGIDEVGFNLELFDREIAAKIMPAKGAIPISTYELAYKKAVSLWGRTGAVRSLLVLGLEPIESFYAGVEWLCQLGVMPIVSVFRPMDSIVLKDALPPDNQELKNIFNKATSIASKYGLTLGPSCIACQNNTLSFPL